MKLSRMLSREMFFIICLLLSRKITCYELYSFQLKAHNCRCCLHLEEQLWLLTMNFC